MLLLLQNSTGNSINGALIRASGSTLMLDDKSAGTTALTVSGGFTNDATIAPSTKESGAIPPC
jgi:hypothetical protein